MKLLFVKGDKGLVANYNGKFYFPDRKSNIKDEGLYDCIVTNEKDTYSFVTGKLVDTIIPPQECINPIVEELLFGGIFSDSLFKVKEVGLSTIIFIKNGMSVQVGYCNSFNIFEEIFSYMIPPMRYRTRDNILNLYSYEKFLDKISYDDVIGEALKNVPEVMTGEKLMKGIVSIICKFSVGLHSWESINSITVYDERVVVIEVTQKYTDSYIKKSVNIYGYNTKYGAFEISDLKEKDFGEKTVDIAKEDVEKWMIENHVGIGSALDTDVLHTHKIEFMGNSIDITYFNGREIMHNFNTEDIEKVEKSFNELNVFRKRVGKNISKNMLGEFVKLSDKNILGISF